MLWYMGLGVVFYTLLRVALFWCKMVHIYVLPLLGFKKDLQTYGEWAVVTGSTDGIGKA